MQLAKEGVQILPLYAAKDVAQIRDTINNAIKSFPYFKEDAPAYIMGSFQALGDPGSAWHPVLRELRKVIHDNIIKYIIQYSKEIGMQNVKTCSVLDRLMIRPSKIKISGEEWHRDVGSTEFLPKGGNISFFGGWLNLDDDNQKFTCVPGSHLDSEGKVLDIRTFGAGFSRIPKEQHEFCTNNSKVYEIPPGCVIVFHQHIAHTITKNINDKPVFRLFHGFVASDSEEFKEYIFGGEQQLIINAMSQSVPLLPGGKQWPIFGQLHNGFKNKPFRLLPDSKDLNRKMIPLNLEGNYRLIFKDSVVDKIGVERFLPSMDILSLIPGIEKFPQVYDHEVDIYRPKI